MTDSVVVEGYVRLRDGKKWKTRWLVLRKPSPVADCLTLLVFKDKSDKAQGNKEKASVTLEEICGLEAGQWYEGAAFTLVILCLNQTALLGFDSREALQAWDVRLRYILGEVHRFSVGVLPGTKLESGPATLHLCNNLLALARDVPPAIIGHWNLPDLRRYGPVPNGFVFEGGTRCGYWAGVFLLQSAESEQISFLFDCVVRGVSPTRGPFGLRPVLPDPSAGSQTNTEEKLNHEAQELEKRLSVLSHRCSTVSSAYCPSAGGDDRSISGSSDTSDTSQSDCSIGSRLAIWTEPTPALSDHTGPGVSKVVVHSPERLQVCPAPGGRPPSKPPRQLQEIGRQSSSDSGIASGSHSSYTGSFSSYTGSLDITSTEDFGSVFSLPPHLAQDLSPCTCPSVPEPEYQVPTSHRFLYDSPRSLLQDEPSSPAKDTPLPSGLSEGQSVSRPSRGLSEESTTKKTEASSERPESCHICSSVTSVSKTILALCTVCGGLKGTPCIPASGPVIVALPDQSVDKSACRPTTATEYSVAARLFLEKSWASSGSGGIHGTSEESALPKKGRQKLSDLLADLLSFPRADGKSEAKKIGPNLYESMGPALGNGLKSAPTGLSVPPLQDWQQEGRDVIYENCLKCQREHCRAPPRGAPPDTYRPRSPPTAQSVPSELQPKHGGPHRAVALNAAPLHQGRRDGWERVRGLCQYEEMNGPLVTIEDKRLNSKEERRRTDPAYEIMETRAAERNSEAEHKKHQMMGSCGQQRLLQETEGAMFIFTSEAPAAERPCSEAVTYVNIPVSPASKKQLNYMELELQEPGPGTRACVAHLPAQRKSCTRYAQIDIAATETAHKVGTQHALGRQEGLHTLELKRKGTPH